MPRFNGICAALRIIVFDVERANCGKCNNARAVLVWIPYIPSLTLIYAEMLLEAILLSRRLSLIAMNLLMA